MKYSNSTYGRLGLITIAVIFVVAVSLNNLLFRGIRLDLTENHLYTLSEGTKNILGSIPEPVNLYFFFSDRGTADNPFLRTYASRVKEMLLEFEEHSDEKLRVSFVDPIPFSEDEDRATELGLQGVNAGMGTEAIYMGIAGTNSIDDEETIPFLDPSKEAFLEYDLAKLVDALAHPERPVIGVISSLDMMGQFDPRTQRMGEPWVIATQVQQAFELQNLPSTVTEIDEEIAVLAIVHPKGLTDATLYAIDQFILRGGRALLFVDPYAEADLPTPDPANPQAAMMASRASELQTLLTPWGVSVADGEAIGDDRYALTVSGAGGRPTRHLGIFGVDPSGMDDSDVVTANLSSINLAYPGSIVVADDAAVTVTPLLQSSDMAGSLPTGMLGFIRDPDQLRDAFSMTGERYTFAARIQGDVPSAFADGPPEGVDGTGHLARSASPINVILVADADLLTDRLWTQVQSFFGQRIATAFANNGAFVLNALDNLTGSGDLISIRGRATFTRPFTRVQALRVDAENQFRQTEQQLQSELSETERKLGELQVSREDSGALILSTEQETELERFQQERLRIRKELRQVRRGLDQKIENLDTRLKLINIGLVPVLITVFSIVLVVVRRRARKPQSAGN